MTEKFDAVKLMRELRNQLSKEMEHMTAEERIRFIRLKAAATTFGMAILRDKAGAPNEVKAVEGPPGSPPAS